MPKPVCLNCGKEMILDEIGAILIFMAFDPPAPYKAYNVDIHQCPQCKTRIVARYADVPFWQNGDPRDKLDINGDSILIKEER